MVMGILSDAEDYCRGELIMTSGYMECPKCGENLEYGGYENGVWIEHPEPWKCPKCKRTIITDKEKGYGLKVGSDMEL